MKPSAETCFSRIGMRVPKKKGKCLCGEVVLFGNPYSRTEHFLVCPEVDKRIAKKQAGIVVDYDAVMRGMAAMNLGGT